MNTSKWEQFVLKYIPFARTVYLRIAEPRVIRILHLVLYVFLIIGGSGVLLHPPHSFQSIIGLALVYIFGVFLVLGGVLAGFAVLPGIWWLERAGLLSMATGMGIYLYLVVSLKSSSVGVCMALAFITVFTIRFIEIRKFQLAPKVPKAHTES